MSSSCVSCIFLFPLLAQQDVWLEMCARNIELPPASMASPDCVGHLMKLGHRAKEWQRRLCLLKDACLYFYVDINVSSALGIITIIFFSK